MSEDKAPYQTETCEVQDAMNMLGKGYNLDPVKTEFVSTISGFTPAPDILSTEYGYVTSLVWGRVWRYCQMSDGVCRASLEKIAKSLGMSERTIIRHLEVLCEGGYLLDTTPELTNTPHIYADTGKIKIRFIGEVTMTESQRAMTQSQRQGDRESVEESIKKPNKKNKPDLLDAELQYHLKPKAIRDAFAKHFRLTPNWEAKYNRQFMEWAVSVEMTPDQVELAAEVWRTDRRFNWKAADLRGVQEHWLELIAQKTETAPSPTSLLRTLS